MEHTKEDRAAGRMEFTTDKDKLVAHCKAEILQLIEADVVPAKLKNFGELHDHCDANEVGHFCEDAFNDWLCEQLRKPGEEDMPQALVELVDAVQNDLNTWIESGAMARERAAVLIACFKERHPESNFEVAAPDEVGCDEEDCPRVLIVLNVDDMCVVDPLSSSCGRFELDPSEYGISKHTAQDMRDFNNISF